MTLETIVRDILRDEIRTAVREELRAQLGAPDAEPKQPAPEKLLQVEQVAEICGSAKPETVREWIRSGRLIARKAGHRYVVRPADVDRFLTQQQQPEATPDADEQLDRIMSRLGRKGER
jgi:excisionase family DNA binding protein